MWWAASPPTTPPIPSLSAERLNSNKTRSILHKQKRRYTMRRIGTAIRLVFYLPALWVVLAALTFVVAVNSSEPFADILRYAIQRLFLQ